MLKNFKYIIYKQDNDYVSQCLNVDIASFGHTIDEAIANLKEALELYYEGNAPDKESIEIDQLMIGETQLNKNSQAKRIPIHFPER